MTSIDKGQAGSVIQPAQSEIHPPIINIKPIGHRRGGSASLKRIKSLDQSLCAGGVLMVAVCIIGVGKNAGHIRFRKQAQTDGKGW